MVVVPSVDGSSHQRSLAAAYHVEICRWIQGLFLECFYSLEFLPSDAGSSCQLNPEYARHLLSNSPSQDADDVQNAVLDEADCMSMTHEGA